VRPLAFEAEATVELTGMFDSHAMMPVALILAATSRIGFAIFLIGKRSIPRLCCVEEKTPTCCRIEFARVLCRETG
jgi:hypothetical protein